MTQEEYDKIQVLLGRRGNKRFAARKQFVLRGFIRCGECGCLITAQSKERVGPDGKPRVYTYYHRTKKRPCSQRGYKREDELFRECVEELDKWELIPELYDWSMEVLNEMAHAEIPECKSVEATQQRAIDEIQAQYDTLLDMSTRRLIDEEAFVAKSADLKSQLKELRMAHVDAAQDTVDWYEYMTRLIATFMNVNVKFASGDIAAKKEILLAIGQNPVLVDGNLRITPNEWLIPLRENTKRFNAQMGQVRTMTEQMKTRLLEALRLEWYPRQELNLRP